MSHNKNQKRQNAKIQNNFRKLKPVLFSESSSREVTKAGRESLDVLVEVSGHLERCYHTTMVTDDDGVPMARIVISLRTHSPLTRYF
jgi:hypothetical protein